MILFFSPYSHIMEQRVTQYQVGKDIRKKNLQVAWFIDDTGEVSRFSNKNFVRFERLANKIFNFEPIFTSQYTNSKISFDLKQILLKLVNLKQFMSYEFKGIQVGRICATFYLYLEQRIELTEDDLKEDKLTNLFLDTIFSLKIASGLLKNPKIQTIISYNAGYPPHRAFLQFARNLGLSIVSMEGGINFSKFHSILRYCPGFDVEEWAHLKRVWTKVKHLPLKKQFISEGFNHLLSVLNQDCNHCSSLRAGSTKKEKLIEKFDCSSYKKVILVATSSEDELRAASIGGNDHITESLFYNQLDWIEELINFAKLNTNFLFIIRIHPREFRHKESQMASRLLTLLEKCPKNIKVNLPSDQISAHDFVNVVDLLLVAISNIATEFLMLGIPVLRYCKSIGYPDDHGYLSNASREQYFEDLIELSDRTMTLDEVKFAFRFNAINKSASRLHLNEIRYPAKLISLFFLSIFHFFKVTNSRQLMYICRSFYLIFLRKTEGNVLTLPIKNLNIIDSRYNFKGNLDVFIERESFFIRNINKQLSKIINP